MSQTSAHLTTEKVQDAVVVHFHGPRITNVNDIREIGDILFAVLEKEKPREVILDFEKVNYLPSAMLGKLAAIRSKVLGQGGTLKLTNLQEPVAQLFKMTHLEKIFQIYKDLDSAMKAKAK
ncbi:MAG: STAS domain-containing protein [Planctomycetes bacterium]|nr:STAS domain-containing protein [Planctomycetota bacterium]